MIRDREAPVQIPGPRPKSDLQERVLGDLEPPSRLLEPNLK
jgi:hypothetical protein